MTTTPETCPRPGTDASRKGGRPRGSFGPLRRLCDAAIDDGLSSEVELLDALAQGTSAAPFMPDAMPTVEPARRGWRVAGRFVSRDRARRTFYEALDDRGVSRQLRQRSRARPRTAAERFSAGSGDASPGPNPRGGPKNRRAQPIRGSGGSAPVAPTSPRAFAPVFLAAHLGTPATTNAILVPRRPRTRRTPAQLSAVSDLAHRFANLEGMQISFAVKLPAQLAREAADRMEGFEFALATELQDLGECGFTGNHDRHGWRGHHVHGLAVVHNERAFSGLLRRLVMRHFGDLLTRARRHGYSLEEHDDPTAAHTVLHWQPTLAEDPVRQCAWALDYAAGHFGQGCCLMNPRALGYDGVAALLQVGPDA